MWKWETCTQQYTQRWADSAQWHQVLLLCSLISPVYQEKGPQRLIQWGCGGHRGNVGGCIRRSSLSLLCQFARCLFMSEVAFFTVDKSLLLSGRSCFFHLLLSQTQTNVGAFKHWNGSALSCSSGHVTADTQTTLSRDSLTKQNHGFVTQPAFRKVIAP